MSVPHHIPTLHAVRARTHLMITCHPSPTSLCAGIARLIQQAMHARGDTLLIDDLAALGFDPVVGAAELAGYFDEAVPADIAPLVDNLRAATDLIFVLPVWNFSMPAQLKGYFDRLLRPHVAFELDDKRVRPLLSQVLSLTTIVTHGMTRADCEAYGDWTRGFFATSLPAILPGLTANARFDFYALDAADPDAIGRDLETIRRHFSPHFDRL